MGSSVCSTLVEVCFFPFSLGHRFFTSLNTDCLKFCFHTLFYIRLGSLEGFPHQWRSWRRISKTLINTKYVVNHMQYCSLSQIIIFFRSYHCFSPHYHVPLWVQNEQYRAKLKKSNERTLALIKASMDIVVAVGLLQLAPKKVNPRVTGAFGFVSSLISCYQVITDS